MKAFAKGRSIIGYHSFILKKLLIAASQAIVLMINSVWYRGLGQLTTPCIWKAIHDIFQSPDDSIHLAEINDDLIGFFNSVPRDAIQDALDALISDFQQLRGGSQIAINLRKGAKFEKAFLGKLPVVRAAHANTCVRI